MGKKNKNSASKKMTHEERRIKYTLLARERRNRDMLQRKNKKLICFKCRKMGHVLSDCPIGTLEDTKSGGTPDQVVAGMKSNTRRKRNPEDESSHSEKNTLCYKCGSTQHSLKDCHELSNEKKKNISRRIDYSQLNLPFATCFVCKQMGHLSGQCPENQNGIYIKGGNCRQCGAKDHLFVNCPFREVKEVANSDEQPDDSIVEEDLEENVTMKKRNSEKKRRVVTFGR